VSDSVERVREALRDAGHADTITMFPEGTRTAKDAANAVGCTVAQIVKSIVLRADEQVVLVLTSGANRVDTAKISRAVAQPHLSRSTHAGSKDPKHPGHRQSY